MTSKHRVTLPALLVAAAACLGTTASAAAQDLPALDGCMRVVRAERYVAGDPAATPPNNYGLEFGAESPRTADIRVRLYARETTYLLDLKSVAIDRAVTGLRTVYTSRPIVVAGLDQRPFLGVVANATGQASSCAAAASNFTDVSIAEPPSDFRSRVLLAPVLAPVLGEPPEKSCETPWQDAATVVRADPIYPPVAEALHQRGISTIEIALDPTGKVLRTSIYHSSGSKALDDATIEAVQRSTFRPKVVDCEGAAGEFLFIVRWYT